VTDSTDRNHRTDMAETRATPTTARESATWRDVINHSPFWQWAAVASLTRMTPFMTALGFVAASIGVFGSDAIGGLMMTAYVLANLVAPLNGRIHDRFGASRSLPWQLALGAIAFGMLTVALERQASSSIVIASAAGCGLVTAGMSGAMRSTLADFVGTSMLRRALAVDAFLLEACVVLAPLVVVLATIRFAWGGVAAMALFTSLAACGAVWLRGRTPGHPVPAREDRSGDNGNGTKRSLWTNPRFLFWILVSVSFGHVLGTAETGALPLARTYGMGSLAGAILIGTLAVLSMAGAFAYASFADRSGWSEIRQALMFLVVMAIGSAGLAIPDLWLAVLVSMALIGFCTAPLNILRQTAVEGLVPPGRRSEAFATLFAANGVGFALAGLSLAAFPLPLMLILGGSSATLSIGYWQFVVRHATPVAAVEGAN